MPLIGSSREFGFSTRMRTFMRWEKMSALCISRPITDSRGVSNLGSTAQPASSSEPAAASNHRRARRSGMGEHVRRDQHAFFGDQEALGVFTAVMPDAGACRQLAVLVDDGVLDLAVRPDADIGQDHGAFDIGS